MLERVIERKRQKAREKERESKLEVAAVLSHAGYVSSVTFYNRFQWYEESSPNDFRGPRECESETTLERVLERER